MEEHNEYIPGACNIGGDELVRRKRLGYSGIILAVILLAADQVIEPDRIWRLAALLPFMMIILGFYQARERFCVRYGLWGAFSFGQVGKATSVPEKEALLKDRARAVKMTLISLFFGIILTVIYYRFPL